MDNEGGFSRGRGVQWIMGVGLVEGVELSG